jgi:hypothetical protein
MMTLDVHLRLFGRCPLAGAIYQGWGNLQPNGIFTLRNPRYFFDIPFARYPFAFSAFCWATAIWLFVIAVACLVGKGRFFIVLYWYSELLLATPLMLWIGVAAFNHLGRIGPNEYLPECLTMLVCYTLIPVVWAMRLGAEVQRERRF